jgi:transposase
MRSVGLDLGKKEVSFCEVRDGLVVCRKTARGLSGLEDVLGPDAPKARVAIEACREAWHIHDVLTKNGHEVLIIDTTRVKRLGVGAHGRKTDRLDAECFARAVEERRIPLAHVLSPARRALREKLNARRALVETRAQFITNVRGIVRARGEKLASCDTNHFRATVQAASLSDEARAAVAPMVAVLVTLDEQLSKVELELEELAKQDDVIANLTSAPGTNLIVAAVFVSVVDEAKRFPDAHKLQSYLGIVPSEATSGGRDNRKLGAITKCGNGYARAMLVQAAWCILRGRKDDPLAKWGNAIAERRGNRIAVVAVARRLAGVLWAMWRHTRPYDPRRLASASARGLQQAAWTKEDQANAMHLIAKKAALREKAIRARSYDPTTAAAAS